MKTALRSLLDDLDTIAADHDEITDTDVREHLADAISQSFVSPTPGDTLPQTFGMFTGEGNMRVHDALACFLNDPEVVAARTYLRSPEERLEAFEDSEIETAQGSTYDEYFGSSN